MAAGRRAVPSGCGRRRRARGCRADRRDRAAARAHRRTRGRRRRRPVGRCPIWHCRAGPRPQPVGGPPPARPRSLQAHSVAACSRRRWCRGWSLGAPDKWKSRAERLQTLRSSPLPSLALLLDVSGHEPAERIKRSPRDRGSRSYGAVAVFGKRRAGWRNWMMGVWL